jgi:TIR domain
VSLITGASDRVLDTESPAHCPRAARHSAPGGRVQRSGGGEVSGHPGRRHRLADRPGLWRPRRHQARPSNSDRGCLSGLRGADGPAARAQVWFDKSELRGGDVWDRQIRKQIRDCALFIPIICAHSQARLEGYFRREWKLAADRIHDMAEEKAFLVPVVIDTPSERQAGVPDKVRDVQWTQLPALWFPTQHHPGARFRLRRWRRSRYHACSGSLRPTPTRCRIYRC